MPSLHPLLCPSPAPHLWDSAWKDEQTVTKALLNLLWHTSVCLPHWSLKSLSSPFPVKAWFLLLAESTNLFPFKVLKTNSSWFTSPQQFPFPSPCLFSFFILFNILLYSSSSSLMWLCASRFPSSLSDWRLPWIILVLSVFKKPEMHKQVWPF